MSRCPNVTRHLILADYQESVGVILLEKSLQFPHFGINPVFLKKKVAFRDRMRTDGLGEKRDMK